MRREKYRFSEVDLPTRVYTQEVKKYCETQKVLGMAHITGGGLESNINRVLPSGLKADIYWSNPRLAPSWAKEIAEKGNVSIEEMCSVFNMGVGYVYIVPASATAQNVIGTVVKSS